MVTSEDGKRSDTTVRGDTPDGGRGLDIIGSLLTITGIRAISRGIARVCGGDAGDSPEPIEAFCLRCRVKTLMTHQVEGVLTNNTPVMSGKCSVCGARVRRIMKRT